MDFTVDISQFHIIVSRAKLFLTLGRRENSRTILYNSDPSDSPANSEEQYSWEKIQ